MTKREASCSCGRVRLTTRGEPVRVSVCHCLECQKRTGSAFAAQARFLLENVEFAGAAPTTYTRKGESGSTMTQRFCSYCGATVWYALDSEPDRIAVPIGAFADPQFPQPRFSVYESRKHDWVELNGRVPIERMA
jgi:hypothetical protein